MKIYVDADACPVKEEAHKVATRHGLEIVFVSNSHMRLPTGGNVRRVVVAEGADAADDWIAEQLAERDIVVTADIPLASRSLKKRAMAIAPTGKPFTDDGIGMALAMRELMKGLREESGMQNHNPVFVPADRSRFLQALENAIQALKRSMG
jgi:uncharacterized protein YaiI (UPF0178 family)